MEPTTANMMRVLSAPPALLPELMAKVIQKLQDEGTSRNFIHQYIGELNARWHKDMPQSSWTPLQKACVDAGYIEAVAKLTLITRRELEIATHSCIGSLISLVKCASFNQRKAIFKQMMQHRLLEICIDKADNHQLCLHRSTAKEVLRCMAADLFLGEELSAEKTADFIEKCLGWVLEGPERVCNELMDPKKAWQAQMMFDRFNIPPTVASKYGNRYYAMSQENSMWTVYGLIGRYPIPPRQFFLDMLRSKPTILDQLLECAAFPLPKWYPESAVAGIASEILAAIMQFPLRSIPGLPLNVGVTSQNEREEEYQTSISNLKVLMSRPNWRSKVLGIWKNVESMSFDDVVRYFHIASDEYYARIPPDDDTYEAAANNRGQCRIVFLRLVASLALVDDIKDEDLLSFLRPSYLGMQKWQIMTANSSPSDVFTFFERGEEVCRSPLYVVECELDVDPTVQLPQETTIAPIALTRLLHRLAQRGILDQAQVWTALPPGCDPSTSLAQVKQITSPAVLQKLLSISVKRATARRELGLTREPKGDHWHTRFGYTPAAELASALVQFDESTGRKWTESVRGARKELALNLNLAAETSMKLKEYETAAAFFTGAVNAIEGASSVDSIPRDMLAKVKRRTAEAKRRIHG
ncbi:hypothetical protein BXZ70DRAFT_774710 [Cristinia sonorae]|uniref:Uncharacterized protein n=1 Tax=Cristinia sonorae TaxID=1940300 RepID=A0A8K0UTN0_9AGAR|nr:hypothetical protein BXZ70DRAFT_774710 [Cristinia sonorae]